MVFSTSLFHSFLFVKQLLNTKCVFWFSLQHLFETFLILRRIQRDVVINVKTSSCKVPVILLLFTRILIKLKFSQQIFVKSSNIKFHLNPASGSRVVPCVRTNLKLIVACCNLANAPRQAQNTLFYILIASRPSVELSQPTTLWVPGSLSTEYSGRIVRLTALPHAVSSWESVELYIHAFRRAQGQIYLYLQAMQFLMQVYKQRVMELAFGSWFLVFYGNWTADRLLMLCTKTRQKNAVNYYYCLQTHTHTLVTSESGDKTAYGEGQKQHLLP